MANTDVLQKTTMFLAAIFLGLGGTVVTVAALAMAADLIGKHNVSFISDSRESLVSGLALEKSNEVLYALVNWVSC